MARGWWLAVVLGTALTTGSAEAQTIGTFSWQLQPFCNVVSLTVSLSGPGYTLDGFDDQCGLGGRAPITGGATSNADGTIGFGFTVVTAPGGAPVHVAARITLAALSGTWNDSAGNTGAFAFGAAAAGSPRPLPAGVSVGSLFVAANQTIGGVLNANAVTASSVSASSVTTSGAGTFASLSVSGEADIAGNLSVRNVFADGLFASTAHNNAGGGASLQLFRERLSGTSGIPVLSGDGLGTVSFRGRVSGVGARSGAFIAATTTQNWSFTASGAKLTFHTNPNGSNAVAERMVIDHDGQVGIGTSTPDQLLSVNGNASKAGGGSWLVFSDERLKTVEGPFGRGLAEILTLEPIRYRYRPDNPLGLRGDAEYIGFSAQAVQQAIPEAVTSTDTGYLQLNADPLLWAMVNAVKELKATSDELRARNAALEARLAAMEAAVGKR